MTFQVRWHKRALNRLTDLWVHSDSATREILTATSNDIDRQLSEDPYARSESRPNGRRIAFFSILTVYFRVSPDDRTVTVIQIHRPH